MPVKRRRREAITATERYMESVKILAGSNLTQNYLAGKSMERKHGQDSKKIVLKTLMLSTFTCRGFFWLNPHKISAILL